MKHVIKVVALALFACGMQQINAISTKQYQDLQTGVTILNKERSGQPLTAAEKNFKTMHPDVAGFVANLQKAAGSTTSGIADPNVIKSIDNKLDTAVKDVDSGKEGEAVNKLLEAEKEGVNSGFFTRMAGATYDATLGKMAAAWHYVSDKIWKKNVMDPFDKLQQQMIQVGTLSKEWAEQFPKDEYDSGVNAADYLSRLKTLKATTLHATAAQTIFNTISGIFPENDTKKSIELNPAIIANALSNLDVQEKFANQLDKLVRDTTAIVQNLHDVIIRVTSTVEQKELQQLLDFKRLCTSILRPLTDTLDLLIAYAQEERKTVSTIILFDKLITNDFINAYEKSIENTKQLIESTFGNDPIVTSTWSKKRIAAIAVSCGVGAYLIYKCYQNNDLVLDTLKEIKAAPLSTMASLAKATPGAIVSGLKDASGMVVNGVKAIPGAGYNGVMYVGQGIKAGASYVGGKAVDLAKYGYSWVPGSALLSTAASKDLNAISGYFTEDVQPIAE